MSQPGEQRARRRIRNEDYAQLLSIRTGLRRFERWSAAQAESHGLTAAQHQLLLAIRGHDLATAPTVGDVAEYLLIKHHSAVELVDRTERGGWLTRERDQTDHRVVRLALTASGHAVLAELSAAHLAELGRLRPVFGRLIDLEDA